MSGIVCFCTCEGREWPWFARVRLCKSVGGGLLGVGKGADVGNCGQLNTGVDFGDLRVATTSLSPGQIALLSIIQVEAAIPR